MAEKRNEIEIIKSYSKSMLRIEGYFEISEYKITSSMQQGTELEVKIRVDDSYFKAEMSASSEEHQ